MIKQITYPVFNSRILVYELRIQIFIAIAKNHPRQIQVSFSYNKHPQFIQIWTTITLNQRALVVVSIHLSEEAKPAHLEWHTLSPLQKRKMKKKTGEHFLQLFQCCRKINPSRSREGRETYEVFSPFARGNRNNATRVKRGRVWLAWHWKIRVPRRKGGNAVCCEEGGQERMKRKETRGRGILNIHIYIYIYIYTHIKCLRWENCK